MMIKRLSKSIVIAFFIALVIVFFAGAYYVQKNLLPQQLRTIQANLNVPIRYAFVTDVQSDKLTILDTYEKSVLNTIKLSVPADFVSVSRLGGFLAYAKRGDSHIYLLDLEKKTTRKMMVPDRIEGLSAHFNGRWLVYQTHDSVVIVNREGQIYQRIATTGLVSVTYHPDGERLFVAELSQGVVWQYDWRNRKLEKLLSVGENISPLSVMPDGSALLFTAKKGKKIGLQRYSLTDGTEKTVGFFVALLRPYVTADSRSILVIETNEKEISRNSLLQIDAKRMTVTKRFPLGELLKINESTADWIRTGWLGQIAVVAGKNALYSVELDSSSEAKKIPLSGDVKNMLVQSDSKILLATVADSQAVWSLDLRTQTLMPEISLPLKQPDTIVMGQTNTLCH